jgi:hypothetical protein
MLLTIIFVTNIVKCIAYNKVMLIGSGINCRREILKSLIYNYICFIFHVHKVEAWDNCNLNVIPL